MPGPTKSLTTSSPGTGIASDGWNTARANHTIQVDVITSTAGTGGTHSVVLEGSLTGGAYNTLGTVTLTSTSTDPNDASNHAWLSVSGAYLSLRARWTTKPTAWVGTLNATIVSA